MPLWQTNCYHFWSRDDRNKSYKTSLPVKNTLAQHIFVAVFSLLFYHNVTKSFAELDSRKYIYYNFAWVAKSLTKRHSKVLHFGRVLPH